MSTHLVDGVGSLSGARIGVVGDVMLDRFVYGDVDRISPEAPVPVMKLAHTKEMLGGVGNVAANIASLGACVTLIGLIGNDEAGFCVRRLVQKLGADADALVPRGSGPTTIKTRIVARSLIAANGIKAVVATRSEQRRAR